MSLKNYTRSLLLGISLFVNPMYSCGNSACERDSFWAICERSVDCGCTNNNMGDSISLVCMEIPQTNSRHCTQSCSVKVGTRPCRYGRSSIEYIDDATCLEGVCVPDSYYLNSRKINENNTVRAACERLYSCGDVRGDEKSGGIESCVLDVEEDNPSPDCTNCIATLDCPELSQKYRDCNGFPCGEVCCDQYDLE